MNNYIIILLIAVFFSSCSNLAKQKYDSSLEEMHLNQKYLNKNYIGMTRKQIIYMFGIPIISDSFNDVYHYHIYAERSKNIFQEEILSLYFKNNQVFSYNIR
ncbi:outer membrane protein assembly factor BamE [Buchnera aphidicola]|uniref:Outer membrane protein assembly factor BamE n=1 Tax=Buchnera aphidicola str. USDA (Myzus persicae) TaxID=1009856 RepID=W0P0B6_BUCMP|nr:outer membrane protein assembly factor BamE [Buchnera aphidicola]AHG60186.1 Smpa [Buchnera aphidicola str. USDA (Myzus persicae)]AHG60765.1 Smpa [Buchnera aphidicola str. W106 (Myzus persicae)]AHG61337.1 Smpa [Buchnera aphidicola str. G002 (Myzus persicae)]AHG61910.1 Smpa [Buchnera aphidicola str. F009 (Myzus persicae)]WAI03124.1 MAG: outer membrane protein assembly factor BamE [Buchnera aphidicola (Myzus persicae)]